ncbi:MAG: DUF120 domain-containing protein [Chloroflexi bacterium]|nr:DUF120 domain-containing protein [Chloroflexota bacterium]
MTFKGRVCRRSSAARPKDAHVAGEREVFKRNPQRKRRIKEETGWLTVFDGTLNLAVPEGVFEALTAKCPLFVERPKDVEHPTNPRIPEIRDGYYYYRAVASVAGEPQEVLVKRAGNPHDKRVVELVAPVGLMGHFSIDEGSEITVSVAAKDSS